MKNKHTLLFFIFFASIVVVSIIAVIYADSKIVSIISTVSTLLGILGLLFSFSLDRNISESSFLFNLYQSFHSNEKISALEKKLEKVFLGEDIKITTDDRENIVEYLLFFETLASMERRGVISISSFDPLFGYDFFIAINNPDVNKIELSPYKMYYSETVRLAEKWKKYRIKRNYPIPLNN